MWRIRSTVNGSFATRTGTNQKVSIDMEKGMACGYSMIMMRIGATLLHIIKAKY